MKFVQKLIQDTKDGKFDFSWYFSNPDKYTFKQTKHPLSDMNFNLSDSKDSIIFPNGLSLQSTKEEMSILREEVVRAMNRAVDALIKDFVSGTIETDLEEAKKKKEQEKSNLKEDKDESADSEKV